MDLAYLFVYFYYLVCIQYKGIGVTGSVFSVFAFPVRHGEFDAVKSTINLRKFCLVVRYDEFE